MNNKTDNKQIAIVKGKMNAYWVGQGFTFAALDTVDMGKKYAKIVEVSNGRKSVHTFINMENGDILEMHTSPKGELVTN